jgi:hypothetical protein
LDGLRQLLPRPISALLIQINMRKKSRQGAVGLIDQSMKRAARRSFNTFIAVVARLAGILSS